MGLPGANHRKFLLDSVQKCSVVEEKKKPTNGSWLWAGWWYEDSAPCLLNPGSSCSSRQPAGLEAGQRERGSSLLFNFVKIRTGGASGDHASCGYCHQI